MKSTFALVILVLALLQPQNLKAQSLAPFPAKYAFVNESEIGDFNPNQNSVNEVIIPAEGNEFALAHFLPIPFGKVSSSLKGIGLGKNHFLMISICLSAFFLVLSYKNKFETEVYEFYNRTSSGEVIFESVEMAKTHEFKSFLALIMKIVGIISAFIAIILIVF